MAGIRMRPDRVRRDLHRQVHVAFGFGMAAKDAVGFGQFQCDRRIARAREERTLLPGQRSVEVPLASLDRRRGHQGIGVVGSEGIRLLQLDERGVVVTGTPVVVAGERVACVG